MINRHILSSNLSSKIDYDLDLSKIGVLPEDPMEASKILGISASQLGLKKRLDNLNAIDDFACNQVGTNPYLFSISLRFRVFPLGSCIPLK